MLQILSPAAYAPVSSKLKHQWHVKNQHGLLCGHSITLTLPSHDLQDTERNFVVHLQTAL